MVGLPILMTKIIIFFLVKVLSLPLYILDLKYLNLYRSKSSGYGSLSVWSWTKPWVWGSSFFMPNSFLGFLGTRRSDLQTWWMSKATADLWRRQTKSLLFLRWLHARPIKNIQILSNQSPFPFLFGKLRDKRIDLRNSTRSPCQIQLLFEQCSVCFLPFPFSFSSLQ